MVASLQPSPFAFGQDMPHTGRNINIFQPPNSPSTTAMSPSYATATDYFGPSARKRSRADSRPTQRLHSFTRTPRSQTNVKPWLQCPTPTENSHPAAFDHDNTYATERYSLADGFDTPSLKASHALQESFTHHPKHNARQTRESAWQNQHDDTFVPLTGPLARERNGAARMTRDGDASTDAQSWTGLAFGLVGKVFTFGTSVIRGFYAGGGQGFDFKGNSATQSSNNWQTTEQCSTPLPGAWNEDDFSGDFEQDNFDSSPAVRPPTKRRQTDRDAWVVVDAQEARTSAQDTNRRATFDATAASHASTSHRQTASRASSRRTIAPTTRRMPSYTTQANGSPANIFAAEPRASQASMRTPQHRPSLSTQSAFISPEAERYVKRQARQDKAVDRHMSSMSRQLEDLIRQGQEALGTKVSIEALDYGTDMDEGFVDDE